MKKLILVFSAMMFCFMANAQEPEKKKEPQAPTRGQERAINESGVSVKSEPKKKSSAKVAPNNAPAPNEQRPEEQKKDIKKPE